MRCPIGIVKNMFRSMEEVLTTRWYLHANKTEIAEMLQCTSGQRYHRPYGCEGRILATRLEAT